VGHYSEEEGCKLFPPSDGFCVLQHHFVVVYGLMMFDEESYVSLKRIETGTTNILLHYQFVKF